MKNLKAFTLVELIVVVTILAILSTIGFVSYSGYLTSVRDTNRIASLTAISDGLELYRTRNDLPLPDDSVKVKVNGTTIARQGYVGKNVLQTIEYSKAGKDPKDDSYYSYYLTDDNKYYQLMAFLEESYQLESYNTSSKTGVSQGYAAINYSNRYPKVYGKTLGMLTDANNTPIQEVNSIVANGELDIFDTTDSYSVYYSDSESISGTGIVLRGGVAGGGLVGYWNFDSISNNSFIDHSQNAAVGTLSGGLTTSGDAVLGQSALFDGIDDAFSIDLIKDIGGNSAAPHTITAWIKPNVMPGVCSDNLCRQRILILGNLDLADTNNTGPGTVHWLLGGRSSPTQFGIWSGTQKQPILNSAEWTHIAFVFNGSKLELYKNGVLQRNISRENNNTRMNIKNSKLYLGQPGNALQSFYDGRIDELRIYNRPLSQKEVEIIYNSEKQ